MSAVERNTQAILTLINFLQEHIPTNIGEIPFDELSDNELSIAYLSLNTLATLVDDINMQYGMDCLTQECSNAIEPLTFSNLDELQSKTFGLYAQLYKYVEVALEHSRILVAIFCLDKAITQQQEAATLSSP